MVAVTPADWLPILAKRLDSRAPRIALLRSYTNGNSPMPEMGPNTRASWVAFQRKACTTYGGLAVDSLAGRISTLGVSVGGSDSSDATRSARRIWRDNRLDVVIADVVRDYLVTSIGYVVTGRDADGRAVTTREIPEQFIAASDPLRPWKARAALKVIRDVDLGLDFAFVWVRGARQTFSRKSNTAIGVGRVGAAGDDWVAGELETYLGDPPIVILERQDGVGLFEPHIAVIDRINLGKLQRLVITAMQAYKQRAIKGGLPPQDADGNDNDWAGVFEAAPGALWDLPLGVDVWESSPTDINPLLAGEKTDARDFAAVTRTPVSAFIPEGENQSAAGAQNARAEQVSLAKSELDRIKSPLAVAFVYALRIEGVDIGDDTVEVLFEEPAYVSVTEKYAAAVQAKAAGESWRSIQRNILNYSPEQIAQDAEDKADEALLAFAFATPQPAVANPAA